MEIMINNPSEVTPLFLEIERIVLKLSGLLGHNIELKINSNLINKKAKIRIAFYPVSNSE